MTANPPETLGPFAILGEIGAGGMGRVYKARDTRLNRIVAIKVLAGGAGVAAGSRRRFAREAQALASLNHPHICVVHDVAADGDTPYIVMEYLEGETLASRLTAGALPLQQALRYAVEIADALDAAHQAGVVHRDLKPSNVILTAAGAKLLDFGLAKLLPASPEYALDTRTRSDLTERGTVLGTPQYMAPEQVQGNEADTRTDIFALGVVLYEMVTGTRAFSGSSRTALMAAILEQAPVAMCSLQREAPAALERLVSVCLAKAPGDRWQSARDVTLMLRSIATEPTPPASPGVTRSGRHRIAIALAAAGMLAIAAAGLLYSRRPAVAAAPIAFTIPAPAHARPRVQLDPFTTLSPDGRHVAFTLRNPEGGGELWVRSLDAVEARMLPGTEGAFVPFWSPDSTKIGFFTLSDEQLKVVGYAGGPVRVLCPAGSPLGGTWNRDGTILFSGTTSGTDRTGPAAAPGIYRVPEAGGAATRLAPGRQSPAQDGRTRRYGANQAWPQFLPDGRHFLYLDRDSSTIHLASVESDQSTALLAADSQAVYAPPGYVLFVREGTLMGQPFDAARLELRGEAFRLAENVRFDASLGGAVFSASLNQVLAYSAGMTQGPARAAWMSRTGEALETMELMTTSYTNRLSADGQRIVHDRLTPGELADLWVIDVERGSNVRLTTSPADEEFPVWSPDGASVAYASNPAGVFDLYRTAATGSSREEPLLTSAQDKRPNDWSPDGRFIAFTAFSLETKDDVLLLDLDGRRQPVPIANTPAVEDQARFSPGGTAIAYRSNRTGRGEIYVQQLPAGALVPASVNGGFEPFWRHDGKELYFISPDNWLMAVTVATDANTAAASRIGAPARLFKLPEHCGMARCVDVAVTPAGRFLVVTAEAASDAPMNVVVNWHSLNASGRPER